MSGPESARKRRCATFDIAGLALERERWRQDGGEASGDLHLRGAMADILDELECEDPCTSRLGRTALHC